MEKNEHTERMKADYEVSIHREGKLELLTKYVAVTFAVSILGVCGIALLRVFGPQKTLITVLPLICSWFFLHLYLRLSLASEEAHRRISAVYLYAEDLREYSVENIDALFEAVNEVAAISENKSLPAPPSEHIRQVDEDKPLLTRERQTLLTIIAAMAVKGLNLNIDQPGKAAGYIEGLTDQLGAHVSKRAIEEHLKKIHDALESRMK